MRIAIIGCHVLRAEIESITRGDPEVVHREYLERGLHDIPEMLRDTIIEKVNALPDDVDVVLIGYGTCNSLHAIPASIGRPFVKLEGEDCIASLLGTEEYAREREICAGTWYSSPGWAEWWAEMGLEMFVKGDEMQGLEEMGFTRLDLARMQLEGYIRCLAIDTGVGDFTRCKELTREMAEQFGLVLEHRIADMELIRRAWKDVKEGRWRFPQGRSGPWG